MPNNSIPNDLIGQIFNDLEVLNVKGKNKWNCYVYECLCKCGRTTFKLRSNLRSGNSNSCEACCAVRRKNVASKLGAKNKKYGRPKNDLTYQAWMCMRSRCSNIKGTGAHLYALKGITCCLEWQDFNVFVADMGERPGKEFTLERKDGNKGYNKENCVWADKVQQANNRSTNVRLTYKDRTLTIAQWAKDLNVKYETLRSRLRTWDLEKALTTPGRN